LISSSNIGSGSPVGSGNIAPSDLSVVLVDGSSWLRWVSNVTGSGIVSPVVESFFPFRPAKNPPKSGSFPFLGAVVNFFRRTVWLSSAEVRYDGLVFLA